MDDVSSLAALGLELPGPGYLVGAILFGIVGLVAFRRGRRAARADLTWAGVFLMAYPYAVSQTWLLWLMGVAVSGWLYLRRD